MWNVISKLLYRVLTLLLYFPIARLVRTAAQHVWVAARPGDPPKDPKKADTSWADALTWALISGVGTAVGRLITTKGAAGAWRAIIGTEPPGHDTKPSEQRLDP